MENVILLEGRVDDGCFLSFELLEWLQLELEGAHYYRSQRAERHPEDRRNAEAAARTAVLLALLRKSKLGMEADWVSRAYHLHRMLECDEEAFSAKTARYFSRIGFDHWPSSIGELMSDLANIIGSLIDREWAFEALER